MLFDKAQRYTIHLRPIEKCSMKCPFCYISQLKKPNPNPMGVFQELSGAEAFQLVDEKLLSLLTFPALDGVNLWFGLHGGDAFQVNLSWLDEFFVAYQTKYPRSNLFCVSNLVTDDFDAKLELCLKRRVQVLSSINNEMLNSAIWRQNVVKVSEAQGAIGLNTLFFPETFVTETSFPIYSTFLQQLPENANPLKFRLGYEYFADDEFSLQIPKTSYYKNCANAIIRLFKELNQTDAAAVEIFQPIIGPFLARFLYDYFEELRSSFLRPQNTICGANCRGNFFVLNQHMELARCSKHFEKFQIAEEDFRQANDVSDFPPPNLPLHKDAQCRTCSCNSYCLGVCPTLPVRDNTGECQNLLSVVDWLHQNKALAFSLVRQWTLMFLGPKQPEVFWQHFVKAQQKLATTSAATNRREK